MAESGVWSLSDDGEWILAEPYRGTVDRVKSEATAGFNEALFTTIAEETAYTAEEVERAYYDYIQKDDQYPPDMITSFVIDAMLGQL